LGWSAAHFAGIAGVFVAGFFLAALLRMFAHGRMLLVLGRLAVGHNVAASPAV
jgi:hypothetical protein